MNYFLRTEFDKSGSVVDFDAVKNEQNLVLRKDPLTYAICWYTWHTTAALQKQIGGEMKPVVNASMKPA